MIIRVSVVKKGLFDLTIGTFRFDYGYEIEYEYHFSNLVCVV